MCAPPIRYLKPPFAARYPASLHSGTGAFTLTRLRNNQIEGLRILDRRSKSVPITTTEGSILFTFFFFIPKSGKQTSVLNSQQIGFKMGEIPRSAWSFTRLGRIPIPKRRIPSNVGYCYTRQSRQWVWNGSHERPAAALYRVIFGCNTVACRDLDPDQSNKRSGDKRCVTASISFCRPKCGALV